MEKVNYPDSIVDGIKTAIAGIHYVYTYSRPYSVLPYPKVGEPNVHQDMKNLRRWNRSQVVHHEKFRGAPYQPGEATCSDGCYNTSCHHPIFTAPPIAARGPLEKLPIDRLYNRMDSTIRYWGRMGMSEKPGFDRLQPFHEKEFE